jgi:hypothetical protein
LPYLVPDTWPNAFGGSATAIACIVVFFELWASPSFVRATWTRHSCRRRFQIVLGGAIVLGVGILIGAA